MSVLRFAGLAAAVALVAAPAFAGPIQPFTMAALEKAQAQGRPVLVDAHADWCPICKAQAPTLGAIAQDPAFAKLVILKLDYDNQKAEKQKLGIRQQSTLIVYSGANEAGRAVGVTDPDAIRDLARKALR